MKKFAHPRLIRREWLKSLIEGFGDHDGLEDFIGFNFVFAHLAESGGAGARTGSRKRGIIQR